MIPGVYAYTDASADAWFAPAGLTRGALGSVIRAERKLPSSTRDTLYEANVNPIATFPNSGVVVFGQKTLQKRASALDRVNKNTKWRYSILTKCSSRPLNRNNRTGT